MRWLLLFFQFIPFLAPGQQHVWVNTDNLILRDRPEKKYVVYAILHAPCRLDIDSSDIGYKSDKYANTTFCQVTISYDQDGMGHYIHGWVAKKYIVTDPRKITVSGVDTAIDLSMTHLVPMPDVYDDDGNIRNGNALHFLPPKYKGGEKYPQAAGIKRIYHKGKRDGCYYIGRNGHKIYVDKKWCK